MLKTLNRIKCSCSGQYFLIIALVIIAVAGTAFVPERKETITFHSADSLLITADHYFVSDTLPYLILLHEQGSSRGEFSSVVSRFQKMNFNCLVVDLRNGGNSNFVNNETARLSLITGTVVSVQSVENDIIAAINYAFKLSNKGVVLLGVGSNGSLALKTANENDLVKAAIALSPGEFFQPAFMVEDTISGIQKPILLTASKIEYPYVDQIVSVVDPQFKTVFAPENAEGDRGIQALLPENESNGEYWLSLLLFFKDLGKW